MFDLSDSDHHVFSPSAHETAPEPLAPADRPARLHPHFAAGEPLVIPGADQRPIQSGRGNLKRVGPGDGVVDVEYRRDQTRNFRAIVDAHFAAIPALGHDLQRGHAAARQTNPDEFVSEPLDGRPYQTFDLADRFQRDPILPHGDADKKKAGGVPTFFLCDANFGSRAR